MARPKPAIDAKASDVMGVPKDESQDLAQSSIDPVSAVADKNTSMEFFSSKKSAARFFTDSGFFNPASDAFEVV